MAKYKVSVWVPVCVTIEVDADDEGGAVESALECDALILSSYVGNGSDHGFVGSTEPGVGLEPPDDIEYLEDEPYAPKAYALEWSS